MNLLIRKISSKDIQTITDIEMEIFGGTYTKDFLETFQNHGDILVAVSDKQIVGLCGWFYQENAAEIIMIGVIKAFRRQKIATMLLKACMSLMLQKNIQKVFIEVRFSNTDAINLYRSLGFSTNRIRTSYYVNPEEDAIEMSVNL